MVFWLSTLLFLGCQTASTQVAEAVMLEQQGDSVAAFDIYKSILSQYPNTPEAKPSQTDSANAVKNGQIFGKYRSETSDRIVSIYA